MYSEQSQGKAKNIFNLLKKNYSSSDKINVLSVWLDFRETLPFAENCVSSAIICFCFIIQTTEHI
jgi:hypothetical protein